MAASLSLGRGAGATTAAGRQARIAVDEALATLRHRAEEALAADGVDHTRLGYGVLVKLKIDDLLEREDLSADVSASHGSPRTTIVES